MTCPVVDVFIFAKANLLNDQGHLRASPTQMNAKDPVNIPDIEIMPVSAIYWVATSTTLTHAPF